MFSQKRMHGVLLALLLILSLSAFVVAETTIEDTSDTISDDLAVNDEVVVASDTETENVAATVDELASISSDEEPFEAAGATVDTSAVCSVDYAIQVVSGNEFEFEDGAYINEIGPFYIYGTADDDRAIKKVQYNRTSPNILDSIPSRGDIWSADAEGVLSKRAHTPWQTSHNDNDFSEGTHEICCVASDRNGLGAPSCQSFCIDLTAPGVVASVSIETNDAPVCIPGYVNDYPSFSWTEADSTGCAVIDHYEVEIRDVFTEDEETSSSTRFEETGDASTDWTIGDAQGGHTYSLRARAVDAAGNADENGWSPWSENVTYDDTEPTVEITDATGTSIVFEGIEWFTDSIVVTESDEDAIGLYKCEYAVENGEDITEADWVTTECNVPFTLDLTTACPNDEECTIFKRATDFACNVGVSEGRTFRTDTHAPNTTLSVGELRYPGRSVLGWLIDWFVVDSTQVTLECVDTGIGECTTYYRVMKENGNWSDWAQYEESFALGEEGIYSIEYYSIDPLNHTEAIKMSNEGVDLTPPISLKEESPLFVAQDGTRWVGANTIFTISATDGETGVGVNRTWYSINADENPPAGLTAVNLRTAGNFVILAKSGISNTGVTSVVGDIGVSPIDSTAITGFDLVLDDFNQFATSPIVIGNVYAADYSSPTPSDMTIAISDMEAAYTDAAGRTNPTATELGAGDISGMTLTPGLYKWSTGVTIPTDVTLDCQGNGNAVFIFQIAQDLTIGNGAVITLSGDCQANNIFWQVGGQATVETTAVMEGTILSQTAIVIKTGAILNGRALAQAAVTLDGSALSLPVAAPVTITSTGSSNEAILYTGPFNLSELCTPESEDQQLEIAYGSIDQLENVEATQYQNVTLSCSAPTFVVLNPTETEAGNVTSCTQDIAVQITSDEESVTRVWATLRDSEGIQVRTVDLTLRTDGAYESLMDKQLPAGTYTLTISASNLFGNTYEVVSTEVLQEGIIVQSIDPAVCSVSLANGGSCDFMYNVCMRGGNSVQMYMDKLGGIVAPGMMEASISHGSDLAYVGYKNASGVLTDPLGGGMLMLSNETINGIASFNLHLTLNSSVVSSIGTGSYVLDYLIKGHSLP